MEGLNTHTCTLAWHTPLGGGTRSAGWMCSCGDHGFAATMSLAAQRFAEHYALAKQREVPKVTRRAPAHDGGRSLTADTIRKSEQVVLAALDASVRGRTGEAGMTDVDIRFHAGSSMIVESYGAFSESRLRTARVELQRAGHVEATGVTGIGGRGRRMRAYRLTQSGTRISRRA